MTKKAYVPLTEEQKEANRAANKADLSVSKRGKSSDQGAPFQGWVNLTLSDGQKAAFASWLDADLFTDMYEAYQKDGVTFSTRWDAESVCFLAKAYHNGGGASTKGYAVSMRSQDAITALQRVVFVVATILEEDWASYASKPRSQDW